MRVRWPFLVAFGVLVVVLGAVGLVRVTGVVREALPVDPARALTIAAMPIATAVRRGVREAPNPELAPPPAPIGSALPLIGDPNEHDRYGVPLQTADRAALLGLLYRERYAELTAHFEEYQRRFEANPLLERLAVRAMDSFDAPGSWQMERLDAWVRATPDSFAPYIARASAKVSLGLTVRGEDAARNVEPGEFAVMHALFLEARADFARALAVRPRLVNAHVTLMQLARVDGLPAEERDHYAEALARCPSCIEPRLMLLHGLAPQWGHPEGARGRYAAEESARWNDPRAAILRARVAMDQCTELARTDAPRGVAACAQVIAGVDDAQLLGDFAQLLWRHGGNDAAVMAAFDRARALNPYHSTVLENRFRFLASHGRALEAARAAREMLLAPPGHPIDRSLLSNVVVIIADSNRAKTSTRPERVAAMEEVTLARTLLPLDRNLQYADLALLGYTGPPSPGQRADAALVAAAASAPDDLFAQREADLTVTPL